MEHVFTYIWPIIWTWIRPNKEPDHDTPKTTTPQTDIVVNLEEEVDEEEEVVKNVIHVVVERDAISSQVSTVGSIGPYNSMLSILLVGEGDFSFSTSLAMAFGSASNMIATSFDRTDSQMIGRRGGGLLSNAGSQVALVVSDLISCLGFLTYNYKKFLTNKRELENRGCLVIHGVDATDMIRHSVLGTLKFDRIIYNFPHKGCFGRSYSDMVKNRHLVRGFIWNAKQMMNEDGEIHITHKSSVLLDLWDVPKIGRDQGLDLLEEVDFDCSLFPGYNPKYGFGGDKNFQYDPSTTYKFGLHPK